MLVDCRDCSCSTGHALDDGREFTLAVRTVVGRAVQDVVQSAEAQTGRRDAVFHAAVRVVVALDQGRPVGVVAGDRRRGDEDFRNVDRHRFIGNN